MLDVPAVGAPWAGNVTPALLRLDEAADVLRCSRSTVERRIACGVLPVVRHGRMVLVDEADVRRMVLAAKINQIPASSHGLAGVTVKPEARLWD